MARRTYKQQAIQLFKQKQVRTVWDDEQEKGYFSIVNVVAVLTESSNPQVYWRVLKKRLIAEGNETVTNCNGLKMRASDGKIRFKELTRRYLTMDFKEDKKFEYYYPLAIYSPFLDERMAAQKACFTIFGNDPNKGLHDIIRLQEKLSPSDKIIDEIVIDGESKKKMLNQLQSIGIDDSSIYPNLDGLGNALKSKYNDTYKNVETSFDRLKH